MSATSKAPRCAIYTRKSSDEGLDQSFNSLDAQREACAAYVRSQIGEGWRLSPTIYDDGGYSGGNMERPALQRLLVDIDASRVDIVVVYKVDRLTRSLADFARIVERLDAAGASFVSVTQAFNTTSSMGRLTLNVLLSFAQFEREITGERIRDKIAASKAKGMWMGGRPALGYDSRGRTLVINEEEAARVRMIFERALELESVRALGDELKQRRIYSKRYTTETGKVFGGAPFSIGALRHLLKNRLYVGEIVHKGQIYPGLHEPIVSRSLFDAVRLRLADRTVTRAQRPLRFNGSPLTGVIFDSNGERLTPTYGRSRHGRTYRYYVSASAIIGAKTDRDMVVRAPAEALEALVASRLERISGLAAGSEWRALLPLVRRVEVCATLVRIDLQRAALGDRELLLRRGETLERSDAFVVDDDRASICVSARLTRTAGAVRLLDAAGRRADRGPAANPHLVRGVARAMGWRNALRDGGDGLAVSIARGEGRDVPFLLRGVRAAYLAPDVVRAILTGRQPQGLTIAQVMSRDLPLDWIEQRVRFGLPARGD